MKELLSFLRELKENNNKEWFQENRKRYETISSQHLELVSRLISEISQFDNDIAVLKPKDCVFRIYRDVRFSNNKDPFKTAIGAVFSKGGRKGSYAGYYLHLEPDNSFVGGGIWRPDAPILKSIRYEIFNSPEEFVEILNKSSFKKWFRQLDGEKLQRPPKDFPVDFDQIEVLKHKSFIVSTALSDENVCDTKINSMIAEVFFEMKDFIAFLNRAVGSV